MILSAQKLFLIDSFSVLMTVIKKKERNNGIILNSRYFIIIIIIFSVLLILYSFIAIEELRSKNLYLSSKLIVYLNSRDEELQIGHCGIVVAMQIAATGAYRPGEK